MRRALLVLVVLLVASSALAQTGATAVRQAARTWTEEQILANLTGNAIAKPLNWGRIVRYGGTITLAAGLIYAGLEWFYDQAQRATGTSLDTYWHGGLESCIIIGWSPYPSKGNHGWYGRPQAEGVFRNHDLCVSALATYGVTNHHPRIVPRGGTSKRADGGVFTFNSGRFLGGYSSVFEEDTSVEFAIQATIQHWTNYLESLRERGDLSAWLSNHPDALAAAGNIAREYADARIGAGFPYTYEDPYGDGSAVLDPPANHNQWHDNAFANPNLDTDGDGWEDWKEVVAGTDPNDATSYPTVDPAPEPEPGDDPLPDTDGDGIPDLYDPCPFDALNRCADPQPEPSEPIEIPDDYAREVTLSAVAQDAALTRSATERTADAVEQIRDLLEGEGELTGEATMPELEAAWSGVVSRLEASLSSIRTAADGKVGFNAGGIIPQLSASGGGSCEEITITLLGITRPLGWCGSTFYNLVTTWGRNGIALLMLIGFAFASARTMGAL